MTPEAFRALALSLPEATEGAHRGHADFRVGNKIFASLGYPDADFAVLLLTPDEQAMYVDLQPHTFAPVPGGWGNKGSTRVALAEADAKAVEGALRKAWRRKAPKALGKGV